MIALEILRREEKTLINLFKKVKSQLLPEGFRDSLPDLAGKEFLISSKFLELMKRNGYSIIKPPLLEFENSLFFSKV